MVRKESIPDVPGYASIKEAAKIINVSRSRMYEYVNEGRFELYKAGNTSLIAVADLEDFKRNPAGRMRTKPPKWRTYQGGGKLLATDIQVQIRPGQREKLRGKLEKMLAENLHPLKGTIARYIHLDRAFPEILNIWLVWKDTEMPDLAAREREMTALKDELAEIVDWDTVTVSEKDGLIYT